jgi:hypothetical protein
LNEIGRLVTDNGLTSEQKQMLRRSGVELVQASIVTNEMTTSVATNRGI